MYILWLKYTTGNLAHNMNSLDAQLLLLKRAQIDASKTFVFEKFLLFKAVQVVISVYIFMISLYIILSTFFLWSTPWADHTLKEIIDLYVVVSIGVIMRFRRAPSDDDAIELSDLDPKEESVAPVLVVIHPPTIQDGNVVPHFAFGTTEERAHLMTIA
eukprot:TRINITY_DN10827_c0_g1_i1.p2 TRINITY_DN10827_c0_g1~~TRINITY_DN10827_c0_g1_i1.p2  ORF type:complete len:158 (-),score=52.43 TRINITY_DN10827_c0_g1_i1:13-486(-)